MTTLIGIYYGPGTPNSADGSAWERIETKARTERGIRMALRAAKTRLQSAQGRTEGWSFSAVTPDGVRLRTTARGVERED